MTTEIIRVPDIGMDTATCIEVSVKPGDVVGVDDTIIVLESDKASMDVPSPMAGKIVQIKIAEGDSVAEEVVQVVEVVGLVRPEQGASTEPWSTSNHST